MITFDLFEDGDNRLPIRTKLSALAQISAIAITDEAITAGAVTSIPVATLVANISASLTKVLMLNIDTGEVYELALSADALAGAGSISITSYTFTADVPTGCPIFLWGVDIAILLYNFINA